MKSITDEPTERNSLAAEAKEAIEHEACAAADAVRAKRHTEFLLAMLAVKAKSEIPTEAKHLTVAAYAVSRSISKTTVVRYYRDEGMPVIPVGTTVRIDPVAADEWRRARGRRPTIPAAKKAASNASKDVDVSDILAASNLRVIGGGK
jgi:hypothetical protein